MHVVWLLAIQIQSGFNPRSSSSADKPLCNILMVGNFGGLSQILVVHLLIFKIAAYRDHKIVYRVIGNIGGH